jgi:hypothetical protein
MKIDWSFLKLVFFCFACAGILTYYPVSGFATAEVMRSVVAGGIMSLLNLLLGYIAIEASFEKSHTVFLKYVLGGMVARLMLMWAAFLLLIRVFGFHAASLMLTLLFFYAMNLGLEIYYLQKKVSTKK